MLTLGVGFGVLVTSLLLTYIISSKADMLFSSGREPANATYWSTRSRRRPTTATTTITSTTTTLSQPDMDRLFSLKHNTRRYTDRLDKAAEGVFLFVCCFFFFFKTTTPCLWTHSGEARHENWTGPDWIGLDASGLIRVRKHWSGTCQWKRCLYFFCFRFLVFSFYCQRMFCLLCRDRH